MSDDLEALWAQAKPVVAPKPKADDLEALWTKAVPTAQAEPGRVESALRGAGQGLTFGLGDEAWGMARAVGDSLPESWGGEPEKPGVGFWDRYRKSRDSDRAANAAADKAHGRYYLGGALVGGLPTAALIPGGAGATTLRQLAKTGAMLGGAGGLAASNTDLTSGRGEDYARAGLDTLGGAAVGGVLPLGLKAAGAAVKGAGGVLVNGVAKVSDAAKALRARGIPLTIGQMNPTGKLAQLEEVGQSVGGFGPVIEGQRDAALKAWQKAALSEGVPLTEGATIPISGNSQELLSGVHEGFGPAYDTLKGHQLRSSIRTTGAFEEASRNPNIRATDATQSSVAAFLKEQLTQLPKETPEAGVPADALHRLRSTLRSEASSALSGNPGHEDRMAAQMLTNAADSLTEVMEQQLPPEAVQSLRAADAQWGKYKVLEDAVRRSGDSPKGMSPSSLSAAVKAATGRGTYARGGGGALRELAATGKEVIDAQIPKTGVRALTAGPLKFPAAAGSALSNWAPVKSALLGETAWQQGAKQIGKKIGSSSLADALRSVAPNPYALAVDSTAGSGHGLAELPWAQQLLAEVLRKRATGEALAVGGDFDL